MIRFARPELARVLVLVSQVAHEVQISAPRAPADSDNAEGYESVGCLSDVIPTDP